jgi:thiol-disulfide isomerase/thioredoxin
MTLFSKPTSARLYTFVPIWLGLVIASSPLCAPSHARAQPNTKLQEGKQVELEGGVAWLNTGKPLKMSDLRGKIVVLDFWTLCCINCMHIMPELARLEKKYKNQVVVIGVHSAKFENEKNSESIRKAILRYELKHPVINDAEKKIWNAYNANWWPTIVLIDPEGNPVSAPARRRTSSKIMRSSRD